MGEHLKAIKSAVISGKHAEIKALVQSAIDAGLDPNRIINEALIPAMDQTWACGRPFKDAPGARLDPRTALRASKQAPPVRMVE